MILQYYPVAKKVCADQENFMFKIMTDKIAPQIAKNSTDTFTTNYILHAGTSCAH